MGYRQNNWTVYDETVPDYKQPDSFITKKKLDNIESGIAAAITELKIGDVVKGSDIKCEIVNDENDPTIKKLNMVIPREVSWHFSAQELHDNAIPPTNTFLNDIVLDIKGNLFSIILNENNEYRLDLKMNIKGNQGISGPSGPAWLQGKDGQNGKDGEDGNRWLYINTNLIEGDPAPKDSLYRDFVLDINGNVFEVLEDFTVHYLINIKGVDGEDGDMYQLEIGEVSIGDTASAEIVNNKLNLTIPRGLTGPAGIAGKSAYQEWLDLGNAGSEQDFINSLKRETIVKSSVRIPVDYWNLVDGLYKAIIVDDDVTTKNIININCEYSSLKYIMENNITIYPIAIDSGIEIFSNILPSGDLIINYSII